ncbi:hypothetical protein [Streptomyces sp. NBC_01367]|uniref:hypothetical protein n=1 Tax=Streptomyces sp. NBC_01367 TaxID=2903841 RepID=UPI00324E2B3A
MAALEAVDRGEAPSPTPTPARTPAPATAHESALALATEGDIAPPRPETAVALDPAAPAPLQEKPRTALPWNDIHSCGGTPLRPRWGAAPTWIPFVLLNAVLMAVAAWI